MSGRLLLRGGCVIDTEPDTPTAHPNTDVLVADGRIAAVGPNLPEQGAAVIDATDHLVLPGFVDAHRHLWQTPLRARTVDVGLGEYLEVVLRGWAPRYQPDDVHRANLAGALECLDSGITTVQDYSHLQYTPAHTEAAVTALRASGIRALFGYGFPVFEDARRPAEVRRARERLFADDTDLVTFALAPAGPAYSSPDLVRADWALARDLGARVLVHTNSSPAAPRPIALLREHGLLHPDTTYVHGNALADDELAMIADSGAAVAISPAVEAQMGHGAPMAGRLRAAGVTTGLGVDVVTATAGDAFTLMRAALLTSQLGPGSRLTAPDVLRLATLGGAAALGMADRVGSLRVGKQADVVLLRATDVNLAGAGANPVQAVVTAAHPGNVRTVLVAGTPVKRDGRLLRQPPALPALAA